MNTVNVSFRGFPELNRRLNAIENTGPLMRDLALSAVREQKILAPVRTGNLRRTIHVGQVTKTSAETVAGASYAAAVEFGTRPHEIRPRNRRALRWKSGTTVHFAKFVRHPGTRKQPYMVPGAEKAIGSVAQGLIAAWNLAA